MRVAVVVRLWPSNNERGGDGSDNRSCFVGMAELGYTLSQRRQSASMTVMKWRWTKVLKERETGGY